jgi:peptidyl-dipeptidase A
MKARSLVLTILLSLGAAVAFAKPAKKEDAKAFIDRVNRELKKLNSDQQTAEFIRATYITDDTERNAATFNEKLLEYKGEAVKQASNYVGKGAKKTDAATGRQLYLLRTFDQDLVAPSDPTKRAELAATVTKMASLYGKGKGCGRDGKGPCKTLLDLSDVMAKSRAATGTSSSTPGSGGTTSGARCGRCTGASPSSATRGPGRSSSPTSASCGARVTTCRPPSWRRRSSACGSR